MGAFSRSWQLFKISIEVMKADKELLLFPLLAGIFSIAFILAMIFPTIISVFLVHGTVAATPLNWLIVFLVYLGLAFISIFFNVCVVYTVKKRFEKGNATFMESIKFAFGKLPNIFAWAMISATVGLVLRIIDHLAENLGEGGEFIVRILTSIIGGVWAIMTVFVVPGMVYYDIGPIDAIKQSLMKLKSTWGENLIREIGLGLAQLVFLVVGFVIGFILLFISAGNVYLFLSAIALIVLYFVAVIVFFSLANSIFSTALYHYAEKGEVPMGFSSDVMEHAFARK